MQNSLFNSQYEIKATFIYISTKLCIFFITVKLMLEQFIMFKHFIMLAFFKVKFFFLEFPIGLLF